jgi:ubiquinone/menaquinone biosynthesis C-methylase UbiE
MPMTVDPRAASGFSVAVEEYERGRPTYPDGAGALLARELALSPAGTVLDLAAGTGKLTRLLLPLVGRVIAVDASEPMLAMLRRQLPGVDARAGTAEAIPLPGGSVDAVVVGEAFHWFGTPAACREIARVLRPGGGLALLWNRARSAEPGRPPWQAALDALTRPYREAAGDFPAAGDRWKRALRESGSFAPLSQAELEHVHRMTPEELVSLVASWSWIANLPDGDRASVLARAHDLVAGEDELSVRYRTEVFWTTTTVRDDRPAGGSRSARGTGSTRGDDGSPLGGGLAPA